MTRIRVLPEAVQSRIAAGEVVERPASVLKELLENALDSGAKRIDVELDGGGLRLVRVRDDGGGLAPEEMPLALERFATSKIREAEEVFGVETLGFRGEALPSIASVSETTIVSRVRGAPAAARIESRGGVTGSALAAGAAEGTTVEVRNLFFNTPARRKFLKGPRAELARCMEVAERLALARPDVALRLAADGKVRMELPPAGRLAERLLALHGTEFVESLAEVDVRELDARLTGYLSGPALTRHNTAGIRLSVGGRPVRDRLAVGALVNAVRDLLPPRRFPVAFLRLDLPAGDVDVNVHPSKAEVRFRRPQDVYRLMRAAARQAFGAGAVLAAGKEGAAYGMPDAPAPETAAPSDATASPAGEPAAFRFDLWRGEQRGGGGAAAKGRPARSARSRGPAQPSGRPDPAPAAPVAVPRPRSPAGSVRYVGRAHAGYLVVETADGIAIVDPHALHERIVYEELRARAESGAVVSQALLVPEVVPLDAIALAAVEAAALELAALGFEVERFGEREIAVRAVPLAFGHASAAEFLREFADDSGRGRTAADLREGALKLAACKAAVKLTDALTDESARSLVERACAGGVPAACPHGRPAAFTLRFSEIEKRFARR